MIQNQLRTMLDRHAQNVAVGTYTEADVLAWAYRELSLIYGGTSHVATQQRVAKLNLMAQVAK